MPVNMTDLIEKDRYVYVCDECKHTFGAAEIRLVNPPNDISDIAPERGVMIMCMDKDGVIDGKHNPQRKDGDKLLACPKCGEIHLNGLDLKSLRRN